MLNSQSANLTKTGSTPMVSQVKRQSDSDVSGSPSPVKPSVKPESLEATKGNAGREEVGLRRLCNAYVNGACSNGDHCPLSHAVDPDRKLFFCPICNKALSTKWGFITHTKLHDPNLKRYYCEVCGTGFNHNSDKLKHVRRMHADGKNTVPRTSGRVANLDLRHSAPQDSLRRQQPAAPQLAPQQQQLQAQILRQQQRVLQQHIQQQLQQQQQVLQQLQQQLMQQQHNHDVAASEGRHVVPSYNGNISFETKRMRVEGGFSASSGAGGTMGTAVQRSVPTSYSYSEGDMESRRRIAQLERARRASWLRANGGGGGGGSFDGGNGRGNSFVEQEPASSSSSGRNYYEETMATGLRLLPPPPSLTTTMVKHKVSSHGDENEPASLSPRPTGASITEPPPADADVLAAARVLSLPSFSATFRAAGVPTAATLSRAGPSHVLPTPPGGGSSTTGGAAAPPLVNFLKDIV